MKAKYPPSKGGEEPEVISVESPNVGAIIEDRVKSLEKKIEGLEARIVALEAQLRQKR